MQVFRCGYSGGFGGDEFVDDALPRSSKVIEVILRRGTRLDSIQIVHETDTGARHPMPVHGGQGGDQRQFLLDADEYIKGITGHYGVQVDSIQFITNKQRSQMFGGSGGDANYLYEAPEGTEVVGFCGRAGEEIDAIGVVFRRR